jgi:hypothetical protein
MRTVEDWHRRHAIQLAAQLPEAHQDATIVVECLSDLMKRWLWPPSPNPTPPRPRKPKLVVDNGANET